ADALDGDAGLAGGVVGGRGRLCGRPGGRCRGGGLPLGLGGSGGRAPGGDRRVDVLAGDDAAGSGRGGGGQVDTQVLGQLAHGRLGQRALLAGHSGSRRGGGRGGGGTVAVQL